MNLIYLSKKIVLFSQVIPITDNNINSCKDDKKKIKCEMMRKTTLVIMTLVVKMTKKNKM